MADEQTVPTGQPVKKIHTPIPQKKKPPQQLQNIEIARFKQIIANLQYLAANKQQKNDELRKVIERQQAIINSLCGKITEQQKKNAIVNARFEKFKTFDTNEDIEEVVKFLQSEEKN